MAARSVSASPNGRLSRSMTKVKMSPPFPQPKHFHESRAGVTTNDGVFSPWNGQRPLKVVPALRSWTVSPTTSATASRLLTSATLPEAIGWLTSSKGFGGGQSGCPWVSSPIRGRMPPAPPHRQQPPLGAARRRGASTRRLPYTQREALKVGARVM